MPRPVLAAPAAAVIAAAALLAAPAMAQSKGEKAKPTPAPTPSTPADAPKDVLKGPSVTPAAAKPTLVQRDFAGKVIRLEVQPAEAAAKLLTLDGAMRAKVDAILMERSRLMDRIVTDNLELLVKLQGARESGDRNLTHQLVLDLSEKAAPLRERGALAQELIGVLPPEQGAELRRLIQEYWKAVVDEDLAKPASEPGGDGARPGPHDRRAANTEEVQRVVGVELKRSYERTVGAQARDFDALLRDLNTTPEQESKIRKLVGDSFNATYGKATPQERARVFWQVYSLLDAEQQKTLIARITPAGHGAPMGK